MTIQVVQVEEYTGVTRESFTFGMLYRSSRREVKGLLYKYQDGTSKVNLPYFRMFEFDTILEAEKFMEEALLSKESLVRCAVGEHMKVVLSNLVKPDCLGYGDSKYDFKREAGRWVWEIINSHTGVKVGSIVKNRARCGYDLRVNEVRVTTVEHPRVRDTIAYAKKILNEGDLEDLIYVNEWKRAMAQLEQWV